LIDKTGKREYLERISLPNQYRPGVLPGEEFKLDLTVLAPLAVGNYQVAYQLVSEHVKWFGNELCLPLSVK